MVKDSILEAHIHNGTIAPSYLLIDKDILKTREIADWFASHYHKADIFRLKLIEAEKTIKVKETEEFIARANLASIGGKKLFIIDEACAMTPQAQNKILKTIEDTPADTCFLLLASSATPILNTVKSRCIIIYPDPITPSLTETAMLNDNRNSPQIFTAVEKLMTQCKTLDDALPHLPLLTKKENLPITLLAFNQHSNKLTIERRNAILKRLSIINRNLAAGCNPTNAFDMLLLGLFAKTEEQ